MSDRKKELKAQYKERKVIGGVFVIMNIATEKLLLDSTTDLQGSKNRFAFALQTGNCTDLKLQGDWARQGASAFVLEVLEELAKTETQTETEFSADIKCPKEMWAEKLAGKEFY
jgi:hypothetical protein